MAEVTPTKTLDKALGLLKLIVRDGGRRPLAELAHDLHLPRSTAHRLVASFERHGLVAREGRGHLTPSFGLMSLADTLDRRSLLERASRPVLRHHARRMRQPMHIGVLEDDMVTYLVRGGAEEERDITREGMQLEAYCSSLGKVLLAQLPESRLIEYLEKYPLVKITEKTIVDPLDLRRTLQKVGSDGFAVNDQEFIDGIVSVAVPLNLRGETPLNAALSTLLRRPAYSKSLVERTVAKLHRVRADIHARLYPSGDATAGGEGP